MSVAFSLSRSVLAAALILGTSALLSWLAPAYISVELSQRLLGVMLGAVVVVYSNAIPKALGAYARLRCSPAQEQAAARFAGWSLVLGGIGYMLASLLAPIGIATLIAGGLLALGLLLAVLRYLMIPANGTPT
jgi:hypothetical protein